jgi:hypothetical protein
VEVMIPEPPGLNGTLTNRFGGNAFFIEPVSSPASHHTSFKEVNSILIAR